MALKLLRYRDACVTLELLNAAAAHVGRHVSVREVRDAVKNAVRWNSSRGGSLTPLQELEPPELRWPEPDLEEINSIVRVGPRHRNLWDSSPEKYPNGQRCTETLIDLLYPGNPLLCCGRESWLFATRRREVWRSHLHRLPLIVPNPMRAVWGRTDGGTGHWSEHTLSNTGARHFLVIEFDFAPYGHDGHTPTIWAPVVHAWRSAGVTVTDACAALLLHLGKSANLALIVNSGGKSLHGWFPCREADEHRLALWMRCAVRIGACTSTWSRSQFVRMPDGTRQGSGHRQAIEYFDLNSLERR
jgi:hypothetical protein